jgi:hypothetical protein
VFRQFLIDAFDGDDCSRSVSISLSSLRAVCQRHTPHADRRPSPGERGGGAPHHPVEFMYSWQKNVDGWQHEGAQDGDG